MQKTPSLTFRAAADYVLRFGKYCGADLETIATDDEGLLYLDWLRGALEGKPDMRDREVWKRLDRYLSDSTIAKELEDLLRGR